MNKPFTELPAPAKERMIIRAHFTKALNPAQCEQCHMARVPAPGAKNVPPMCDVCGRMLCRACFGSEITIAGPDLKQYWYCDECAELENHEIDAILELRSKLGGMR